MGSESEILHPSCGRQNQEVSEFLKHAVHIKNTNVEGESMGAHTNHNANFKKHA